MDKQEFNLFLKSTKEKVDIEIEKILPKEIKKTHLDYYIANRFGGFDEKTCTKSISNPAWELLERGGKRWRPLLMKISYKITNKTKREDYIDQFLPIPELIHNGTLIIDDIEDNSDLRRGKPSIHKIFGQDIAINAGNSLYYLPLIKIIKSKEISPETKIKIYELINQEMIRLSFGQGMDIYWHKKSLIPKENQYLEMSILKTGTLARMSAKLGAILGGGTSREIEILGKFAESMGVAFQIKDDVLNITNENLGKEFGEDITEGKKSLVVIKTLEESSKEDKERLIKILKLKTKNKEYIMEAINIINKYSGIKKSEEIAKKIILLAWKEVEKEIHDQKLKNKLKVFSEFMIERDI